MESLSMKTLANSLPISTNVASEKQLMDNFKAAALSITTLYRSSLDASKQAYSSGYVACLKDILQFVQAGVCAAGDGGGGDQEGEHGMMTIGGVMDWVEARLEAIKSTDEEEEEERASRESGANTASALRTKDDKEKDTKRRPPPPPSQNVNHTVTQRAREGPSSSSSSAFSKTRSNNEGASKDSMVDPQPSSSRLSHSVSPGPPNLPSAPIMSSPSPPPQSLRSSTRSKRSAVISPVLSTVSIPAYVHTHTHESSQSNSGMVPPSSVPSFTFAPDVVTAFPPVSAAAAVAGTKRRHAMMAAAAAFVAGGIVDSTGGGGGGDAPNTNSTNGGSASHPHSHGRSTRRRGYHGRGKNANDNALQLQTGFDSMDVEEDGRDRKRIARR